MSPLFFAGVLNAIAGGGSFVSPPALLASIGGYVGAHFSRRVNQRVMRWTVTAIGFLASGYFLLLNALSHP
ncbi:MAG TPA: hypothetical protein VFU55_07560 [Terracidiphilus sp.]|nr:hypothetical protein [Terracidiphilus sp.]